MKMRLVALWQKRSLGSNCGGINWRFCSKLRVFLRAHTVAFTNVQPHFYRVRQVEPCNLLGWSCQALILSILALGAMPKQQKQQQQRWPLIAPISNCRLLSTSLKQQSVPPFTGVRKPCHLKNRSYFVRMKSSSSPFDGETFPWFQRKWPHACFRVNVLPLFEVHRL